MDPLNPQAPDASTGFAPGTLAAAQQRIAGLQQRLDKRQIPHRAAPPAPTSCCGRGCNGCVWEGYFAAVEYWVWQAEELLA